MRSTKRNSVTEAGTLLLGSAGAITSRPTHREELRLMTAAMEAALRSARSVIRFRAPGHH
jgi:hypothetical protein